MRKWIRPLHIVLRRDGEGSGPRPARAGAHAFCMAGQKEQHQAVPGQGPLAMETNAPPPSKVSFLWKIDFRLIFWRQRMVPTKFEVSQLLKNTCYPSKTFEGLSSGHCCCQESETLKIDISDWENSWTIETNGRAVERSPFSG